eukprot:TRINITY_DN20789_c0_g1_i2.p1 TRINITY_DN20789_c0_g1~~TRINITY_DN20789_c0_g1_i2.p1  ORF type:complete len:165 (+),score=27.29 TRINITY_DN20789_c0_g1_i2:326-820(+)
MPEEEAIWHRAMASATPPFYDGMAEVLAEFQAQGGRIAVVSHSPSEVVERHYEAHPMSSKIRPALIYGWDHNPEKRKPSSWPALQVLQNLGIQPTEALVLDDLAPGVQMARSAGIRVAAAGWGHSVPQIESYMRKECDHYFKTVQEFSDFLLGKGDRLQSDSKL